MQVRFTTSHFITSTVSRARTRVARRSQVACRATQQATPLVARVAHGFAAASIGAIASLLLVTDAQATDLGEQVFNNNCGGKNTVIPDRVLSKEAMEQYLAGGFKLESIVYQVNNGKGAMPAWENILDEDEIQAVAEYVYKMADTNGWK